MIIIKLDGWNKQEIMHKALNTFKSCRFPFEGHISNNEIIFRWKHDTGFRYVVVMNDDGTFYGFDMDLFTGQEIKTADPSVMKLHRVIKKFFEKNGWEYKAPITISWVKVSKRNRYVYRMAGTILSSIGLPCIALFLLLKMWAAVLFAVIASLLGIWDVLIGTGKGKVPSIPLEAFLMLVFGDFGDIWVIIFITLSAIIAINCL